MLSIEGYFGELTSASGIKPTVRDLLGVMDKLDFIERVKFDPTRSFQVTHSKNKKYDPVEMFALNGFLEQWNTGRALTSNPELFAAFVQSVAERAAAATKGKHVSVRSYHTYMSSELRAAMGKARQEATGVGM